MVRQAELLGADWRLLYGGRTRASASVRLDVPTGYAIQPGCSCGCS
jgi:hypothetical protein